MCNIPVTLPTVASFLMLYSLRCGCYVVWTWTLLRSIFYLLFFMVIVIRMYMPDTKPEYIDSRPEDDYFICVFICFVIMIVIECFVVVFAVYLAVGLYYDSAYRVEQYLIGRFCVLLLEIFTLVILIFHHKYFMGWYMVFLMIIILEFYSFIVVYSYYVDILEEQKAKENSDMRDQVRSYDDYMNYECIADSHAGLETQEMQRVSQNSRALRECPSPRNMPQPVNIQSSYCTRAMELLRGKLWKQNNEPDYLDAQCARNAQDCLCLGYR